ncbi:MAG: RNA polymerase sigma factor [bacterium]|nr:RNA polymerase sigma factor [bacterium]
MTTTGSGSAGGDSKGTSTTAAAERRAQVARVVRKLRAGEDQEAGFRVLFEAYHRPLTRFFVRKGFNAVDAVDLTQDTFLGIYQGLKGLRDEDRFESWLYRIATTNYLKRLRSEATAKRAGQEIPHDEARMVHDATKVPAEQLNEVLNDERQQAMRKAIQELPNQMRRCLTFRIYHDLSYREIATVMKLKIDTVKAHLFQARARLKEKLSSYSVDALNDRGD